MTRLLLAMGAVFLVGGEAAQDAQAQTRILPLRVDGTGIVNSRHEPVRLRSERGLHGMDK